jgi:hypothetical protein
MPLRFTALVLLSFLAWMFLPRPVSAQELTPTPGALTPAPGGTGLPVTGVPAAGGFGSPENGASLSGAVDVIATAQAAWKLDFSYADDPTGAWFPLAESANPVANEVLTTWDTTALTDGLYLLRLRVSAADGMQAFKLTVRVRNYSPPETATPTLTLTATQTLTPTLTSTPTPLPEATATATFTPVPSPTLPAPLPPNPAMLNPKEILSYLGQGVLAVFVVFGVAGLAWSLRRK